MPPVIGRAEKERLLSLAENFLEELPNSYCLELN
jgi:hypothetical protein